MKPMQFSTAAQPQTAKTEKARLTRVWTKIDGKLVAAFVMK